MVIMYKGFKIQFFLIILFTLFYKGVEGNSYIESVSENNFYEHYNAEESYSAVDAIKRLEYPLINNENRTVTSFNDYSKKVRFLFSDFSCYGLKIRIGLRHRFKDFKKQSPPFYIIFHRLII